MIFTNFGGFILSANPLRRLARIPALPILLVVFSTVCVQDALTNGATIDIVSGC